MLSTAYRLRLVDICKSIAAGQEVGLEDMIWAREISKGKHISKRYATVSKTIIVK